MADALKNHVPPLIYRRRKKMGAMLKLATFFILMMASGFSFFYEMRMGVDASRVFTIINDCKMNIWPAITPGDNFGGGGFELKPRQTAVLTAPVGWSGRIWGRTGCKFDSNGVGTCQTGACGTALKCGASGDPPASLAEFTLGALDFYDVSLVDGFNLPLVVTPLNGKGNCTVAGCDTDLLNSCPAELAVKSRKTVIACRSACDVFDTDQYCCRGVYGNSATCTPTYYSQKFKGACPAAYSYAYDDPHSIFTCTGSDYVISFCSSRKQPVCSYHNNKLVCSGSSPTLAAAGWKPLTIYSFMALLTASCFF